MKLKVLEDNNTLIDMYYLGEPAVSYYIEDGNDKILFDVGYSDAFMKNAENMAYGSNTEVATALFIPTFWFRKFGLTSSVTQNSSGKKSSFATY